MRPVDKAYFSENQATYSPYGSAKKDLIAAVTPCSTF